MKKYTLHNMGPLNIRILFSVWLKLNSDNYLQNKICFGCAKSNYALSNGEGKTPYGKKTILDVKQNNNKSLLFTLAGYLQWAIKYTTFFTEECWWIPHRNVTEIIRQWTSVANMAPRLQSYPAAHSHWAENIHNTSWGLLLHITLWAL